MKLIKLTGKYAVDDLSYTMVDDDMYDELMNFKWNLNKKTRKGKDFYNVCGYMKGKSVSLSRYLMDFPPCIVDHEDKNRLNNQKSNLRLATNSQNSSNRIYTTNKTSKFSGVMFNKKKNKWMAHIKGEGSPKHIGYFSNENDAAFMRDIYALYHHKEFAVLNFPENIETYKKSVLNLENLNKNNLEEIKNIAEKLLNKYCDGWTFRFSRKKMLRSQRFFKDKRLELSKIYCQHYDIQIVIDTVLHEIAHILLYPNRLHHKKWYNQYKEIGGVLDSPQATNERIPGSFWCFCQTCNKEHISFINPIYKKLKCDNGKLNWVEVKDYALQEN